MHPMYWATSTFRVTAATDDLIQALRAWRDHIKDAHPGVKEVRCYRADAGTEITWMEGFENFHDYQDLIEQEDDVCAGVMEAVYRHAIPGTRTTRMLADAM